MGVVEELDLGDGGGADEVGVIVELRANLHAAACRRCSWRADNSLPAAAEDARAGAQIVCAVHGNPRFDAHQIFEEDTERSTWRSRTSGNFGERLDLDWLLEIVNQRGAGHAGLAVDAHGAGAADLFEAIGVVGDGRGGAAFGGDGVRGDLHHGGDDVHALTPLEFEVFPYGGSIGSGLALDFEFNGLCHVLLPRSSSLINGREVSLFHKLTFAAS